LNRQHLDDDSLADHVVKALA